MQKRRISLNEGQVKDIIKEVLQGLVEDGQDGKGGLHTGLSPDNPFNAIITGTTGIRGVFERHAREFQIVMAQWKPVIDEILSENPQFSEAFKKNDYRYFKRQVDDAYRKAYGVLKKVYNEKGLDGASSLNEGVRTDESLGRALRGGVTRNKQYVKMLSCIRFITQAFTAFANNGARAVKSGRVSVKEAANAIGPAYNTIKGCLYGFAGMRPPRRLGEPYSD